MIPIASRSTGSIPGWASVALVLVISQLTSGAVAPSSAEEATSGAAAASARVPITQLELANGLRIFAISDPTSPTVSGGLWLGAGWVHNPRGQEGLADLCAAMHHRRVYGALENGRVGKSYLASEFSVSVATDHTSFGVVGLADDLDAVLATLRAILPGEENAFLAAPELKHGAMISLLRTRTSPGLVARNTFATALFGDRRPLGLSARFQTLLGILPDDVREFHAGHYHPGNAVLTFTGAFDTETLRQAVAAHFADWEAGTVAASAWGRAAPGPAHPGVTLVDDPDAEHVLIIGGLAGPGREDPDFTSMQLLHHAIGAGRIENAIQAVTASRPEGHLFRSQLRASARGSEITVEVGVPHGLAGPTLIELRRALDKLARSGVDEAAFDAEVEAANAKRAFRFEAPDTRIRAAVELHLAGRPLDAAEDPLATTRALDYLATNTLWRELLDPERIVWVVHGRGDAVAPELSSAGIETSARADVFEVVTGRLFEEDAESATGYASAASTAQAEELLMAAIEAKGSFENLERIESYAVQESLFVMVGPQGIAGGDRKTFIRFPDRMREELTMGVFQDRTLIQVVNGPHVWKTQLGRTRVATGEHRHDLLTRFWLEGLRVFYRYAEPGSRISLVDLDAISGVTVDGFRIRSADGRSVEFHLHPESRQVVRRKYRRVVDKLPVNVEEMFTDYRAVEGTYIPFVAASYFDGEPTTQSQLYAIDLNLPLPDEVFIQQED